MDAAATDLQEEEDVKALEPDRLHGEEVDRQHLVRVLTNELTPGALAAAWGGLEPMASEHVAHGAVGAAPAQLQELALDATGKRLAICSGLQAVDHLRSFRRP